MLSTPEFKEFAKDVVLFTNIMSRVEGEKHQTLLSEKGGTGFPYVVAMSAEGDVLSELSDRSVDGFKAMMKAAADDLVLRAKKDPTPAERLKILGSDLARGRIKGPEYRERAAKIEGLDEAGIKERETTIVHLDIDAEMDKLRKAGGPAPELRLEIGKIFAGMHKAGRVPTERRYIGGFYELMMIYGENEKDPEIFGAALAKLKEAFGGQKQAEEYFKTQEAKLEAMKAGGAK